MEVSRTIKDSLIKEKRNVSALAFLAFFAFICKGNIIFLQEVNASLGGYMIAAFTDHHYIMYGLMIYCLYWMIKDIRGISDQEKVRYGSYSKYYTMKLVTVFVKISIYILAHLLIVFIIGLGRFRFGIDLRVTEKEGMSISGSLGEVVLVYGKRFPNAIYGIVLSTLYLIMGLFFIYVVIFFSYELKGMVIAIPIIITVLMSIIIGFKVDSTGLLSILFLDRYLMFHHLFWYECWPIYMLIIISIEIMVTLCMYIIIILYKTRKDAFISNEYTEKLIANKKIIYICIGVYIAIFLFNTLKYSGSSMDFILNIMMGFSYSGRMDVISVVGYLMYFICPIVLLGIFLENKRQDKYIIAKARYRSNRNWESLVAVNSYKLILFYSAFMMLAQGVVMAFLLIINRTSISEVYIFIINEYGMSGKELVLYIYASSIIRIVELIILFEIMYISSMITQNETISFVIAFVGYIVSLIIDVNSNVNPFGAGALVNLVEKSKIDVVVTLVSSSIWMILLIIIRKKFSYRYNKTL